MKLSFRSTTASRSGADLLAANEHKAKALSFSRRASDLALVSATPASKRADEDNVKVTVRTTTNVAGNQRGMHMAGDSESMRLLRAKRRFYNRQMPKLVCSSCSFSQNCPQFKAGFECAYLDMLGAHRLTNRGDIIDEMRTLAEASLQRVHLQSMFERLSGQMPGLEVTESFTATAGQLAALHKMEIEDSDQTEIVMEGGNSIVAKLFGDLKSLVNHTSQSREIPIDVTPPALAERTEEVKVDQELLKAHNEAELYSLRQRSQDDSGKGNVEVGKIKV